MDRRSAFKLILAGGIAPPLFIPYVNLMRVKPIKTIVIPDCIGVDLPPFHINCRSFTYFVDDMMSRMAEALSKSIDEEMQNISVGGKAIG